MTTKTEEDQLDSQGDETETETVEEVEEAKPLTKAEQKALEKAEKEEAQAREEAAKQAAHDEIMGRIRDAIDEAVLNRRFVGRIVSQHGLSDHQAEQMVLQLVNEGQKRQQRREVLDMLKRISRPSRNTQPITTALRNEIKKHIQEGNSQSSLALASGVKQPQISAFLNGTKDLSMGSADKIAHALKIAPD